MAKLIWIFVLVVSGCLASNDNNNISDDSNRDFVEETIKGQIVKKIEALLPLLEAIDGSPIIDDVDIPLENIGELTINSLLLNGISKLEYDITNVVVINGINNFTADIELSWTGENTLEIEYNHNLDLTDPNSELSWLAGNSGLDLLIKDTTIILSVTMEYITQLKALEIDIKIGKDTEFKRLQLGTIDLTESVNGLLHNQDIQDIIIAVINELIQSLMGTEKLSTENFVPLVSAKFNQNGSGIIKDLLILTHRLRVQ